MENENVVEEATEKKDSQITENEPVTKKEKKESSYLKFVPIILTVAVIVGAIGIYLNFYSNPKRIVALGIDKISTKLKNAINSTNVESKIKDNYTLEGKLNLNAESEYLTSLATYSTEYQMYSKLLTNLSKTENSFKIVEDLKSKKLYAAIDSKLNNSELINAKYLIENNTEYYFIKGFLNSYVNNGTNDFFESLDKNSTSVENMLYVYDVAVKSFKQNLKSDYFTKKSEEVTIDGKKQKLIKNSLVINDKRAKEIAKAVLKDLKADKKANKILTDLNKDFKNSKVKDSNVILEDDEKIVFNVYTDSLLYNIKKYEISTTSGSDETSITYEEKKDTSKIEVLSNSKVQAILNIKKESDQKSSIEIMDANNKKIGEATITNSDTNKAISLNITSDDTTIDFSVDSTTKEEKKNEKYVVTGNVTCKITSANMVVADVKIGLDGTLTNDTTINEDVSNSVLASSVTSADQTNFSIKIQEVLLKLMS